MITTIYQPIPENIALVGKRLAEGDVVGIPTETVYGLAADAWNDEAVRRIFSVKGRPQDNPLIVHISAFDQMKPLVKEITPLARKLANAFWPGPLTIVQPKNDAFCSSVTAGLDTVAIRMPSHPVARAIIEAAGTPLAAPSANISGIPSPTTADHVYDDLNARIACIMDGGECEVGVESTVVSVDGDSLTLLRPGGITLEQLKSVCEDVSVAKGVLEHLSDNEKVLSPGMKYRHYAPKVPVIILDGSFEQFVAYVHEQAKLHDVGAMVFSGEGEKLRVPVLEYGASNSGKSEATGLFSALRRVDSLNKEVIYARMPAKDGVGFAVYNRLLRAAAFHVVDLNAPKKIRVIGLTGQTGAGKSTVCEKLQDYGYYHINCDKLARTVVEKGSDTLAALVDAFGEDILLDDGGLNRRALGTLVFTDPLALQALNAITHPAIVKLIESEIIYASGFGCFGAIVDAPTLFESGADRLCDTVLSVVAENSLRTNRIMERDGLTQAEAEHRVSAQHDEQFYKDHSGAVIYNNGSKEDLIQAAWQILKQQQLLPEDME